MPKPKARRKARPKKRTKLQRSLLKRLKKTIKTRKRDYASEYKRRVALAKKKYREEIALAKKRRDAALKGVATRRANALKRKRSASAQKGLATRRANAERRKQEAAANVEKPATKPKRLTSSQVKVIVNWYENKFNQYGLKGIPSEEDLIEFAQERGYDGFKDYRKIWDAARATYLKENDDGTYESRGYGYLVQLTDMAKVSPQGEEQWLYYH